MNSEQNKKIYVQKYTKNIYWLGEKLNLFLRYAVATRGKGDIA